MKDLYGPPVPSDSAAISRPEGLTERNIDRLLLFSAAAGVLAFTLSASSRVFILLILRVLQPVQQGPAAPLVKTGPLRQETMTAPASRLQERALEDPFSPNPSSPLPPSRERVG